MHSSVKSVKQEEHRGLSADPRGAGLLEPPGTAALRWGRTRGRPHPAAERGCSHPSASPCSAVRNRCGLAGAAGSPGPRGRRGPGRPARDKLRGTTTAPGGGPAPVPGRERSAGRAGAAGSGGTGRGCRPSEAARLCRERPWLSGRLRRTLLAPPWAVWSVSTEGAPCPAARLRGAGGRRLLPRCPRCEGRGGTVLPCSSRPARPVLVALGVLGRLYGGSPWPFRPGDVRNAADGGVGTVHAHLRRDQRDRGGVSGAAGPGTGVAVTRCRRDRPGSDLSPSSVGDQRGWFQSRR